jgi:hypothetical protein
MVRVSTEGREGRILRDQVIENLITDTKAKARMLGVSMFYFYYHLFSL